MPHSASQLVGVVRQVAGALGLRPRHLRRPALAAVVREVAEAGPAAGAAPHVAILDQVITPQDQPGGVGGRGAGVEAASLTIDTFEREIAGGEQAAVGRQDGQVNQPLRRVTGRVPLSVQIERLRPQMRER